MADPEPPAETGPDPRDPRVQAEKYLEAHKIPQLLEVGSA